MEDGLFQQFVLLFDLINCLVHLLVQLNFFYLQGIQSIPGSFLLTFSLFGFLKEGLG